MKLIVLLSEPLILLLEGCETLLVQLVLSQRHIELILRPLVGLCHLQQLGEKSLRQGTTLNICRLPISTSIAY